MTPTIRWLGASINPGAIQFSDDAVTLIHTTARGYPRAVNNLALQSLVATFAANKAIVDEAAARTGVSELLDE